MLLDLPDLPASVRHNQEIQEIFTVQMVVVLRRWGVRMFKVGIAS